MLHGANQQAFGVWYIGPPGSNLTHECIFLFQYVNEQVKISMLPFSYMMAYWLSIVIWEFTVRSHWGIFILNLSRLSLPKKCEKKLILYPVVSLIHLSNIEKAF